MGVLALEGPERQSTESVMNIGCVWVKEPSAADLWLLEAHKEGMPRPLNPGHQKTQHCTSRQLRFQTTATALLDNSLPDNYNITY
jgi:hypothetical protein